MIKEIYRSLQRLSLRYYIWRINRKIHLINGDQPDTYIFPDASDPFRFINIFDDHVYFKKGDLLAKKHTLETKLQNCPN